MRKSDSEALIDSFGMRTVAGTTVPFHQGRDISPTLVRQIAKDIGLSIEDFLASQPAQQPNTARQPTADEEKQAKKPSEPGRG